MGVYYSFFREGVDILSIFVLMNSRLFWDGFSGKFLWGFWGMIVENNLSAISKCAK